MHPRNLGSGNPCRNDGFAACANSAKRTQGARLDLVLWISDFAIRISDFASMMLAQVLNALLGIWLMTAPAVLGYDGIGRTNSLIVGPIAATFPIIAIWEVVRGLGKVNVALGIWLVIAPLILDHGSMVPVVNSFFVGLVMIALAIKTGQRNGNFAGGWRSLVDAAKTEVSAK